MLHRAILLALAMIVVISSQCVAACEATDCVKPPAHCHEDAKPSCERGADQETPMVVDLAPALIVAPYDDSGVSVVVAERAVVRVDLRPKPPLRI
ncbi:MAG: hypothetical protein FJW32_20885 [Acidobacteria bacterium]|nr:hypothetical protein [Acidobacteriota bacterium]